MNQASSDESHLPLLHLHPISPLPTTSPAGARCARSASPSSSGTPARTRPRIARPFRPARARGLRTGRRTSVSLSLSHSSTRLTWFTLFVSPSGSEVSLFQHMAGDVIVPVMGVPREEREIELAPEGGIQLLCAQVLDLIAHNKFRRGLSQGDLFPEPDSEPGNIPVALQRKRCSSAPVFSASGRRRRGQNRRPRSIRTA